LTPRPLKGLLAISFVLGVTIIVPIAGADVPVVVSMPGRPDLRHAQHRGLQAQDHRRQQALDGRRLRRPGQRAVLHGQDDDGVR